MDDDGPLRAWARERLGGRTAAAGAARVIPVVDGGPRMASYTSALDASRAGANA